MIMVTDKVVRLQQAWLCTRCTHRPREKRKCSFTGDAFVASGIDHITNHALLGHIAIVLAYATGTWYIDLQ